LINSVLVAFGGFLGAMCRFAISRWMSKHFPSSFPTGTLTVNLIGSFILGLVIGWGTSSHFYLFIGTGFTGAFTTFSTFKLENIQLHADRKLPVLSGYLLISYTAGIALAFTGYAVGKSM
jgi:CrcB protein